MNNINGSRFGACKSKLAAIYIVFMSLKVIKNC